MKRKYVLFFALVAFMYLPAFGAHTPQIGTEENREGRLRYAKELSSFLEKIDNQIPSLSPSQEEWLIKEIGEPSKPRPITKKYLEVMQSKEYNINVVKSNLNSMIYFLDRIVFTSKNKILWDEKDDIRRWLVIVDGLMDFDFWQDLITLIEVFKVVDSKLVDYDSEMNISQVGYVFYLQNGMLPARQILRNIITPYFTRGFQDIAPVSQAVSKEAKVPNDSLPKNKPSDNSDPNQPKQKAVD